MKPKTLWLSLLMLFLEGCRDHMHSRLMPVPSVPVSSSRTPAAPVESKPEASQPKTQLTAEILPPANEPIPIRYSLSELLPRLVDAYFDLDQHDLQEDARTALRSDASLLNAIVVQSPDPGMVIEGHCDERGSAEYNLALGAMRAEAAKEFLVKLGIPSSLLKTITYGKERPQCTMPTEECWHKNRRAHLTPEN